MISEIQTITRFLASVRALETTVGAKESSAAEYYATQYVYPVRDAFNEVRDFCLPAALVVKGKKTLSLSDLGNTYLDLGDKKGGVFILEPNRKQKEFLSREVFLTSSLLDQVKTILYNFHRGSDGEFWLSKEEAVRLPDQNFLGLLLQLEILVEKEKKERIELSPQYASFLEVVVSHTLMVITPDQFKASEAAKIEIANISEKYVLQNERNRLIALGAVEQSKKVDRVSLKNVAAGYDVASFNDKDSIDHDRFIEVKAGKPTPINFFFSRNEFETAKRLRNQYFIYYVCIKGGKPREVYVFQNPIEGVMKDQKFYVRTDTYEIREN